MESKIIEKVQNLLELAYDAPNDEEGQTALLMAQKLMVKHNLSMTDVTATKRKNNIGEIVGTWEYRLPWWQEQLASILGENFRCKTIRRRDRDKGITQMIFFGYQFDAELCTRVYEGAILYLKYRLKRLFPTVSKSRWKDYKKSYLLGFLEGLDNRFKDQVQTSETFALMVQVSAEVIEEQRKRFGDLKSRSVNMTFEVDLEAYIIGLKQAEETKLLSEELIS
ncbi:DUF2786 domain-containing protein [Streptococcus canis]|uniref:DUF2786 domain-containing protein n=1 Tax=Streptococcus canis TaxID=1329 RepID=UPI00294A69CA|nr:DUF2786 domain-containing protein [Streptococcus canis]MDV6000860.1 DUF2786 domain-containing protein [Streptococcus canis]